MPQRQTAWSAVIYGLVLAFFAAFQLFKLPPVLPVLLDRYHYDLTLAGGFMSVYAVAGLLLSLPLSAWLKANGSFYLLLIAMALMLTGSAMVLAWPQFDTLVLGARALEGVGFAVFAIAGPVLVNRHASARHLAILVGLTAAWIPVGQMIAALLTPVMLDGPGWQGLWILGLAAGVVLLLWTLRLRVSQPALFQSEPQPTQAASDSAPQGTQLTPRERFALLLSATVFMLWSGQYFAFMTWLPQYLTQAHGLSLQAALWGYLLPIIILTVFNLVAGALMRLGVGVGTLLFCALIIQVLVWFGQGLSTDPWLGLLLLVAYGVGAGISPTCLFALPSAIAGPARATTAFGIVMTGRNLGVLIGPVLLARVFDLFGSWEISGPIFGTATLIAAVITLWLGRSLKQAGPSVYSQVGSSRPD